LVPVYTCMYLLLRTISHLYVYTRDTDKKRRLVARSGSLNQQTYSF